MEVRGYWRAGCRHSRITGLSCTIRPSCGIHPIVIPTRTGERVVRGNGRPARGLRWRHENGQGARGPGLLTSPRGGQGSEEMPSGGLLLRDRVVLLAAPHLGCWEQLAFWLRPRQTSQHLQGGDSGELEQRGITDGLWDSNRRPQHGRRSPSRQGQHTGQEPRCTKSPQDPETAGRESRRRLLPPAALEVGKLPWTPQRESGGCGPPPPAGWAWQEHAS